MQKHKKISARILSLVLSVAIVATMMPITAFATEGDVPLGASEVGTIQSFDELGDRFIPAVGKDAPSHVYGLSVALNTPAEGLNLPDELTATVARTTNVSAPAEDEPVVDSGKPSEPAVDETTVTTVKQETIPVTWQSDKEYKSDANGQFIYTAVLPEGYILADGVNLPQIYVAVGKQARNTRANAITININNGTTAVGGATLQAVVEANGGVAACTSLKITAGKVTTNDWKYLTKLTAMTSFEIDSAVTVDNIPDSTFNPTFPSTIETVKVPQAITIGEDAFYDCIALTSVDFPAVTALGMNAFANCSALTSVDFPAVTALGTNAFAECTALESVSFPVATDIGVTAFFRCYKLTSASFPVATTINNRAFSGCLALTSVDFPAVTALGVDAFSGCLALESVSFPKVESIQENAFYDCTVLTTLKLGATPPATIGTDAFKGCPENRTLAYVGADGNALTGTALTGAQAAYKEASDGNTTDGKWYGWTVERVVGPAITIGTQPTSPAAMTYGSITGSLTVAGTAGNSNTVSYQWYKNTTNSATGGTAITGATSASFTIPTTLDAGTYYYYCILKATGCTDKASDVATVTVNKATVTITANNKSAYVGDAKPALSYTATGIASGDTLTTVPTLTYESEPDMSKVGSVKIKASGAVVPNTDNYESAITYVDGTLTISNKSSGGGGGGSSSGGSTTAPPSGGSAGGVTTPGKTVIDNIVGDQGAKNTLNEALKKAIASSTSNQTVYANFTNYEAITKDGIKAFNDSTAKAIEDQKTSINTKVQLDKNAGYMVVSRITVDPLKLATAMPEELNLGVWHDQVFDKQVTAVTSLFEKSFENKFVAITFEQKSPLAVDMEFSAKLDFSELNTKNLYFYSYNPTTNIYKRIITPNYWVDKSGYSHITAPFGGSIIISDKPLTKK